MSPRRRVLAVCCFFPEESIVEETVRTLGEETDLYLVPIHPDEPVPEAAQPYLVQHRLPELLDGLYPCRKWRAVDLLLSWLPLDAYDWAFFPDDDLEYPERFLPRFLALLEEYDVALAQPALTHDSFHTWGICLQQPESLLRITNFVEIMAPCFRRDALERLRPTLAGDLSPMGYGFDLHWAYACEAAGLRMGVVDAVPVAHRFRPVGTHYAGDDLHGHGYAYGARFPRILPHEICVRESIPRPR